MNEIIVYDKNVRQQSVDTEHLEFENSWFYVLLKF